MIFFFFKIMQRNFTFVDDNTENIVWTHPYAVVATAHAISAAYLLFMQFLLCFDV